MGQMISSVVEKFDNDAEKQRLADDALNSLVELAKAQMQNFRLAISNPNFDAKLIPIESIISSNHVIQANITNTPENIGQIITDSFSSFASGDVAKGVSSLVQSGVNILLGSIAGNTAEREVYLISTGSLGGVFRIDVKFFAYRFHSKQLKDITKEVIAVSVVISSANLENVSDNTLRTIVQQTYKDSDVEVQRGIYNQIKEARDDARKPEDRVVRDKLDKAVSALYSSHPVPISSLV